MTLTTLACALGVLLGAAASVAIAWPAAWPVLITPAPVLLALVFSAAVGLLFGLTPALKASRLDPVQARS